MPRLCKICAYPDQAAVKAAFASTATDRELAQRFGVSHMAIGRHRRAHIVRPLAAAVAALDKGRMQRQQKARMEAIAEGDPTTIADTLFTFASQAAKIERIEQRLERMAAAAEAGASPVAVAQLAGQALRAVEVGSRLGSVGGYATPRTPASQTERAVFSIQMVFPNAGKVEEINITTAPIGQETEVSPSPLTIDGTSTRITPEEPADLAARVVHEVRARSAPSAPEDDEPED